MNTYKLTLIALLASLAVVGRLTFQFLPNVQPVTTLIILCGFFLGPSAGVLIAVLSTYISNLFLGMGFWTIWQIAAWSVIGLISGWMGKWRKKIPLFGIVFYAVVAGYFYGLLLSLATYTAAGEFLPYYLAGLLMDTYHAVGNGIFMFLLFPIFSRLFSKFLASYCDS